MVLFRSLQFTVRLVFTEARYSFVWAREAFLKQGYRILDWKIGQSISKIDRSVHFKIRIGE